jgi:hypothetical protein
MARPVVRLVLALGVLGITRPASAVPVTWELVGVVTASEVVGVSAGDVFHGRITFDSEWTDRSPTFETSGFYRGSGDVYGLAVQIGERSFVSTGDLEVRVLDDVPARLIGPPADGFQFSRPLGFRPPGSVSVVVDLDDSTASVLSSDALPTDPPDAQRFDSRRLLVTIGSFPRRPPFSSTTIVGRVDAIRLADTAVPEPGAAALFALGALVVARRLRRGCGRAAR